MKLPAVPLQAEQGILAKANKTRKIISLFVGPENFLPDTFCSAAPGGTGNYLEVPMIRIHIETIKEKELLFEFKEKPETFPVLAEMIKQKECEVLRPIEIRIRVYRVGDMVEVEGKLETRVRLACSRCLKGYETQLSSSFELTYTRDVSNSIEAVDQKEVELKAEDMGLIFFSGEEIDLMEGIQEQIVLAFPIKPLCQRECQGLCSKCGADLNSGNCDCARTPFDNKFAALRNLKLDDS